MKQMMIPESWQRLRVEYNSNKRETERKDVPHKSQKNHFLSHNSEKNIFVHIFQIQCHYWKQSKELIIRKYFQTWNKEITKLGYGLQYQDHIGCLKKSVLLNFFELLFFPFYFQISTFTCAWYFQIVFWKVCKIQYTHISLILLSHEWKNSLLNIWKKLNLAKRPKKPKETWKQ